VTTLESGPEDSDGEVAGGIHVDGFGSGVSDCVWSVDTCRHHQSSLLSVELVCNISKRPSVGVRSLEKVVQAVDAAKSSGLLLVVDELVHVFSFVLYFGRYFGRYTSISTGP
jgi:hypothetical protein